jgi:UDP-N-acetylglucosamine 2-epimerase (non-hydrolysing)
MKILVLLGTRPEIIRLAAVIRKLKNFSDKGIIELVTVYTNQNYDANLSTIFFNELILPHPDHTFPETDCFFAHAFDEFESVLSHESPDKVLILGDTNSGLLGILAEKRGIPVYHMEAGSRSYDMSLPEEKNRKTIDAFSTCNLPYTDNAKSNLIKEGYSPQFVYKTGNPIY